MSVPARLTRRLREVLGAEASEDMMAFMDSATLQRDVLADVASSVRRLEERIKAIDDRVQGLDDRIQGVEVRLTKEIANVRADLMKWSFLFWVGAVAAIAMLAGVLGQ